eukprot:206428-Alexandrium_andersonii.AAC.1
MSASLVGSEMCIRDSTTSPALSKASQTRRSETHAASALTHKRQAKEAVSYTHLTLPTICSV